MVFRCCLQNQKRDNKYVTFECYSWREAPTEAIQYADHEWALHGIEVWGGICDFKEYQIVLDGHMYNGQIRAREIYVQAVNVLMARHMANLIKLDDERIIQICLDDVMLING